VLFETFFKSRAFKNPKANTIGTLKIIEPPKIVAQGSAFNHFRFS
jgi:hypothetical protein